MAAIIYIPGRGQSVGMTTRVTKEVIITDCQKQKQEDYKFEVSLGYFSKKQGKGFFIRTKDPILPVVLYSFGLLAIKDAEKPCLGMIQNLSTNEENTGKLMGCPVASQITCFWDPVLKTPFAHSKIFRYTSWP